MEPGDVLKVGITWNSRKRMVEASWSQNIPLDGDPDTEGQLLGDLVRKLEQLSANWEKTGTSVPMSS